MNLKQILTAPLEKPQFHVSCPHCGTTLEFLDRLDGQLVTCPACHGEIQFNRPSDHDIALVALQAKRRKIAQLPGTILVLAGIAVLFSPVWFIGVLLIASGLLIRFFTGKEAH